MPTDLPVPPPVRKQAAALSTLQRLLCMLLTAMALMAPLGAHAEIRPFSIPAGEMENALNSFARQAGISLAFDPALTAGLTSPGVSGNLKADEALKAILADSPVVAETDGSGGYRLHRAAPAPATSDDAVKLAPMAVWGTAVTTSSTSMDTQDISLKQADHLSDLLRDVPGVDVGGSHSLNQRINIRGLSGSTLDVRLDGAPQDVFLFHHFGDLRINADILREADIQVGANSIINNGLGGGIRFKTMSADDLLPADRNFGARLHSGHSTNAASDASVAGYGRFLEHFDFLVYGSYVNNDTPEDGNGDDMSASDGEVINGLIKLGVNILGNQRLEVSYDLFQDEGDYPARPNFGQQWASGFGADFIFPTEYNRESLALNYTLDLGDALELDLTVYSSKNTISRWEGNQGSLTWMAARRDADIEGEGLNQGLTLLARSTVDTGPLRHDLTYGAEYQQQTAEQTVDPRSTSSATYQHSKEDRLLQTIYLEDRIGYGIFALIPGVRYNDYRRQFDGHPEQSWSEWTYALGGEIDVTEELKLRAGYTQLFRGPQLTEIFATTIHNTTYNADLKAESGDNREAGFVYQSKRIPWLDLLRLNGTIFRTTINDYIDDWYSNNANIGDVTIDGFELGVAITKSGFDAGVSYSRSRSTMDIIPALRSSIPDGDPLREDVGDSIGLNLGYTFAAWDLKLNWDSRFILDNNRYADDRFDKDGYNVHDLTAQWKPRERFDGMTVTFGIENIFNEKYASHASEYGYQRNVESTDYEPGRAFKLSLDYVF